jgi:pectinesterase
LRNWAAKSSIYNINVANTYGEGHQALALSAYNTEQGYYGCQFTGFQGKFTFLLSVVVVY